MSLATFSPIDDLELFELSLVAEPANPECVVHVITDLPANRCAHVEQRRFGTWECIMDTHEGGHYMVNQDAR